MGKNGSPVKNRNGASPSSSGLVLDPHTKNVIRAVGAALLIAVSLVLAVEFSSTSRELSAARRDLATERADDDKLVAMLKFFELQTTTGVADYGSAPQGIMPGHPRILKLAGTLKTPRASFDYVTERIGYSRTTTLADVSAIDVLDKRMGNCQGTANLLISLFMAQGIPPKDARVVYGHVRKDGMPSSHAWVEVFLEKRWWVADATPYTDAGAGIYDRDQFYSQNTVVPVVVYDSQGVGFGSK
jgi:hypothetical protein